MMKAPLFKLPYLNDLESSYDLNDVLGQKVIILTFWVSWCPDCSRDLPKKEQLYKTVNRDEIEMITINVPGRERNEADAIKFMEQFLTQPVLKDNGRDIYDLYEATSVPTTVIIDKDGHIAGKFGDQADFMEIMEALTKIMMN